MRRKLITITEFAGLMKVTRDTIYKWIAADRLPKGVAVKKVAGRNFISVPIAKTIVRFGSESFELK